MAQATPGTTDEMARSQSQEDSEYQKIEYCVENTFIKLGTGKEEVIYGRLLMLEKCDGCHIEWRPTTSDEDRTGEGDSWALINADAVGFSNAKDIELMDITSTPDSRQQGALYSRSKTERLHNHINFHVNHLKSFRRSKKMLRQSSGYLIFIQDCGTTNHPIYFPKRDADKFITELEKKVIVTQSPSDNSLFLVTAHQADALETSFDALNLFEDPRSALQRFAANPVRGTFSAFAKVSGILTDALVSVDPETSMHPEFCDKLRTSIDESNVTVNAALPEDPDFLFVDERAQLPDVELKPRGEILRREVWERSCDDDGRVTDPARIKQLIYRGGISHELRRDVWKFLLTFYPWDSTELEREELRKQKVEEYFAMKLQWKSMTESQTSRFVEFRDRQNLIEKDVNRTDRTTPFFSGENNEKLCQLNDILMTYVMYNFDLGYVQGMSDLLSPILIIMDNEVDAFWCFVGFMDLVESNFQMDQEGMKLQLNQLNQIVQIVDRKLYKYLDSQDSSNMYFAFRWLLILFKREFSMTDIMRLWEILWTGLPCKNYPLVIATSLLTTSKNVIIENEFSFNEILKHINDLSGHIDLTDLLIASECLAEQLLTCQNLPSYVGKIIGLEINGRNSLNPYGIVEAPATNNSKATKTPPPRPLNSPARKGDY